jgi:hypothetical protein
MSPIGPCIHAAEADDRVLLVRDELAPRAERLVERRLRAEDVKWWRGSPPSRATSIEQSMSVSSMAAC